MGVCFFGSTVSFRGVHGSIMGFSGEVLPEINQESSDLTVGFPNLLDICGMDSFFVSFTVLGDF